MQLPEMSDSERIRSTDVAPVVCPMDLSSYANCMEVTTSHFHLDVRVDFDVSAIGGYNTLSMISMKDGLTQVVLDYQGMTILGVQQLNNENGAYVNISQNCTTYTD